MKGLLRIKRRSLIAATMLAGGTMIAGGSGCMNTLISITPCGTVLTFCSGSDQLRLMWEWLEIPDYTTDPSCTIPYSCGPTDLFPPIGDGGPTQGGGSNPPDQGGGGAGGGGGGI